MLHILGLMLTGFAIGFVIVWIRYLWEIRQPDYFTKHFAELEKQKNENNR
jgi:hypothetical protein